MRLLTIQSAKTVKGQSKGYLTGILYMAPHTTAGRANLCPWSTKGCRDACLYTAGRGAFKNVQQARIGKALWFQKSKASFIEQIRQDIIRLQELAYKQDLIPVVRLNGTTDILWERVAPELFQEFSHVQFYDYTKAPPWTRKNLPSNYHLTFSASEHWSRLDLLALLCLGHSVALVSSNVDSFGYSGPIIDGDKDDLRFLDVPGTLVKLVPKGKAKKDKTGFVRTVNKAGLHVSSF